MEKLRDDFARETDPAKQKEIAEAVQVREREIVTHIHLGQCYLRPRCRRTSPACWRRRRRCSGTSRRSES